MVIPRTVTAGALAVRLSKPFPRNRPDLETEGFTFKPEDWEDEIYLVPEYADELLPEDLITVHGETVISSERSLLDLANVTTGADLWRMLDNALVRGLTTAAALRLAIARHPQHNGRSRLATFLKEWSDCDQ
jgi:hypothetical protein